MNILNCPGLRADSVLAWLAAVGATVLDKRLRLHWTTDATPFAVLSADDVAPLEALLDAWPERALLDDMPVARNWPQAEAIKRHVPVESFRERARMARGHPHAWTLSSTMTDLHVGVDGLVRQGPFDAPVPQGLTLHDRLIATWGRVALSSERIRDSLLGQAARVQVNGLGFDHARLGSLADNTKMWTDPVVETLAFFGLTLLPVRGDGIDERLGRGSQNGAYRQRGWRMFDNDAHRNFAWPAWRQPLDSAGLDALLDAWHPSGLSRKIGWKLLGVHAAWRSVAYEAQSRSDVTRAYGSERL